MNIPKITNILNDCLDNLDGLKVSGVQNCGRVFLTAQGIELVKADLLKKTNECEQEQEVINENDDQCNETQADA